MMTISSGQRYGISIFFLLAFLGASCSVWGWAPSPSKRASLFTRESHLWVSRSPNEPGGGSVGNNDDNDKDDDSSRDYMSVVRALQDSYYKTASPTPPCRFQLERGEIENLPILTWPWHEVPGRSNVLHVHEGTYTHMLETILRSNPPVWYMGHVFRQGSISERKLKTWHNVSSTININDEEEEHEKNTSNNVVLGTLLRITDYRRMADGRLLVLTQAMERFVVKEITQSVPYSVAHVQLLPDDEEEEQQKEAVPGDEAACRPAAILESFEKWHRYEYEQTMLPLPFSNKLSDDKEEKDDDATDDKNGGAEYLDTSQIVGSALAQVLPYSPFSSVVNVERLKQEVLPPLDTASGIVSGNDNNLKQQLMDKGILSGPPFVEPALMEFSCDELEHELWISMDKFLKQTKRAVSPILLGLLPPDQEWPSNFVLERIVNAIQEQHTLDHKCVRVSPHYPAYRRQKRASYAAAAVLEDDEQQAQTWRLIILQIPSTKQRLAYILQCLRDKTGGAFQ